MQNIEAIDLFCGIGGLTYGLQEANIRVLAGLDNDVSCKYSYEKNNKTKFIEADIAKYDFNEMQGLYSKNSIKLLAGCAPCQPFSSHSNKLENNANDRRWNLIDYFSKGIEILEPHIVSMENVRGITRTDIFEKFLIKLNNLGYQVDYEIVSCSDYGVPQNRRRLVLLASKLGKINIPQKTHSKNSYVVIKDVIRNLPKLAAGETAKNDVMHKARKLSPTNLKRIKQSKPKGTWHDWDYKLLPNCYKKESGQSYTAVYGRMDWDEMAPTLTTQFLNYGSGRFGHPSQNRAISLREGALLQTFPESYDFGNEISMSGTSRHIGNAVPPKLGFVIGQTVRNHIASYYKDERR